MVESWEIILGIVLIILFAVTLRAHFFSNFKTVSGAIVGIIIGRISYIYVSYFLNFNSTLIKILMMILGAYLFAGVSKDLFDRVFPNKPPKTAKIIRKSEEK